MEVIYCDLCNMIITPHSKKHILVVNTVIQEDSKVNNKPKAVYEYMRAFNKETEKMQIYEMCSACQKVLKHLFKLRKDKLEKIKNEIEKLYKLKEKK